MPMDVCLCHGFSGFIPAFPAQDPPRQYIPHSMLETRGARHPTEPFIAHRLPSLDFPDPLPSLDSFICTLQTCRESRSLPQAVETLFHIHNVGLEANCVLGNHVVPLLVECGAFSLAQKAFSKLAYPNEHSWTSLIQGWIDCGNYENALDVYERMQQNGVAASKYTFVAVLKACSRLKYVDRGQSVFVEIVKEELEKDPYVGNILVDMYAKCGLTSEAYDIFVEVTTRDVVSWTALISGYVEHGCALEAVHCFEQMQEEHVSPNAITFICVLKACTSMGIVDKGQEIHEMIIKDGFETDVMIGNSLVDMYARCALLKEAHEVFDCMPIRDVITWTSLMAGYAEHGYEEEGLDLLVLMQLEGLSPNAVTYVCALQACCSIVAVEKALNIHSKIVKEGFEVHPLLGSTLVDTYSSFELLAEAEDVFRGLPVRDLVAWTTLIAGYTENGLADKVLSCLDQMQVEGMSLDAFMIACSLKACGNIGAIERGRELHILLVVEGFESDPFIGNSLIGMYARCGSMLESQEVFDELSARDSISWITLAAGYAELGCNEDALKCLEMMEPEYVLQNTITVVSSLKVCADVKALCKGQEIHAEVVKESLEGNQLMHSLLVALYAKCGKLAEAQEMFDELIVRDVVSWTGLITGYADHGYPEESWCYLKLMQCHKVAPDVIAWSAVIAGFNKQGKSEKALVLYAQMLEQGILPNIVTVVSNLKACGKTVSLDRGRKAHSLLIHGTGFQDLSITAALVDMYSECGSITDAQKVFDAVPTKDPIKWNTLITGLARQGESDLVFRMFDGMRQAQIPADSVTFLNALTVCNHVGLLDRGLQYFEAMTKVYRIKPESRHYSSMIDLLCRAGRLGEAVSMLESMPCQPDLVLWNSLLAACWKWRNVEIGRKAFENVMDSGIVNAAACALMSNIYAEAGMMEEARKVEAIIARC
ncbi:hypothetical protein GOP47_0021315 [Adiantum capillus-veneris]|uniref:Pentatricopeptide repeat-containing protein n=1 Tax=Adiantum capillus-veneris TaxID=13818 RepID=A0A9D4Z8D3_ADICA|nr:hypothetical protein GOP47_0021315 [Adiantum capillus-veneris]